MGCWWKGKCSRVKMFGVQGSKKRVYLGGQEGTFWLCTLHLWGQGGPCPINKAVVFTVMRRPCSSDAHSTAVPKSQNALAFIHSL